MVIKKQIFENKPYVGANGQYNMSDYGQNLGKPPDVTIATPQNNLDDNLELYTLVESKIPNIVDTPKFKEGIMWNYLGSELKIVGLNVMTNREETDGQRYPYVKFAVYIFDDEVTPAIKTAETGEDIKSIIGTGNSFEQTDNFARIGYWNKGNQKYFDPISGGGIGNFAETGNIVEEDNSCEDSPCGPDWDTDLIIKDFPHSPQCGDVVIGSINTDMEKWTKNLSDPKSESSLWIIVRLAGDERERILWSVKTDERMRMYYKIRIKKNTLYNMFKDQNQQEEFIYECWSSNKRGDINQGTYGHEDCPEGYGDDYGYTAGHNQWADSSTAINFLANFTASIKGPKWTPQRASLPIEDGGWNARWTDYELNPNTWHVIKSIGLDPTFNMDFTGWTDDWYSQENKYFRGKNIWDASNPTIFKWKPITSISTSYVNTSNNRDIQSYYQEGSIDSLYSSAPNNVKLTLSPALDSLGVGTSTHKDPLYIDLEHSNNSDFKYWFYVANWDWKEGDPGGGECESLVTTAAVDSCLREITDSLPQDQESMENSQIFNDTYKLRKIYPFNGVNFAEHQYIEDGIKIIKVVYFNTVDNQKSGFATYRQAVRWGLATLYITLSADAANTRDFVDVGGSDWVFLPYPDTSTSEIQTPSSVADNPRYYKGSHPIIGGLSEQSVYIKKLRNLMNTSPVTFGKSEGGELRLGIKSYQNSPGKSMDEFGDHLGKANIAQVRYFSSGSFDMRQFLGIDSCYNCVDGIFSYYGDISASNNPNGTWGVTPTDFWNGENNSFPKKSSVGDIFISEYNQFGSRCLVELNCGDTDGTSIRDTSGNGCKGILIGDYSIRKEKMNSPTIRDSVIDIPKTGTEDGAF